MHPLIEQLARRPVLTDGAWATELQGRGLAVGEFPDPWNLSHAEDVFEAARAYVDAGSEIILTNTFGSNRLRLAAAGWEEQVREINYAGVKLSRRAADGRALVFASIGPTGKLLIDEAARAGTHAAFEEQARALAEAGADGLVIETMSDLAEARLAVQAARATGLPVVASMVFDSGKYKEETMMGTSPEQAAHALTAAGADVIGANCGQGIAGFKQICKRLRGATDRPIWIKPNAGLPRWVNGRAQYSIGPEEFAAAIPELISVGATFIGGCCGTSPEFIRAAREVLQPAR